jgi:hypothetical protein
MHPINKFFDKVYVITCERFYERHSYIRNHFNEHNIRFEFKAATDKKYFAATSVSSAGLSLIAAHRMCILDAKLNGCANILICEDDISFISTSLTERFDNFMRIVPNDWDFLQLGNQSGPAISKFIRRTNISDNLYRFYWGTGSHCNGIKSNMYDVCLDQFTCRSMPIDFLYYNMYKDHICYCPEIFIADGLSRNQYRIQDNSKILFDSTL